MSNIKQGSHIIIKESGKEGLVIHLDGKYALILTDDNRLWIPLEKVSESSIVNDFIQGIFSDSMTFLLIMDAYRLTNAYAYNPFVLASSMKIDIFPHQIDEVSKILENPRILIADEVGLGKTIVTGLVISELNARGMSNKILFIVPKSLTWKWISELQNKFDLKLNEITSSNIDEYLLPRNNSFDNDFSIASLDYLRQPHIISELKKSNFEWDTIVFDEAHKLVKTDKFETQRYNLGEILSSKCKFLLLLTATPHDGKKITFYNRIRLLEPKFTEESPLSHIMIRNKKEDIVSTDGKEVFSKRTSKTIKLSKISMSEKAFYDLFDEYLTSIYEDARLQGKQKGIQLVIIILRKRSSSSIYAIRRTLTHRLENLRAINNVREDDVISYYQKKREGDYEENEEEGEEDFDKKMLSFSASPLDKESIFLHKLIELSRSVEDQDSKLKELITWIQKIKGRNSNAKLLIFTEYRDTLSMLKTTLLKQGYCVESIEGTMSMAERQEALKKFTEGSDIMIATDAAGEGLDMQFATNIEVNYDIPWNPNRLEQRMGRIHRIGQTKDVYYYNIVSLNTIDGQILLKIMDKIEEIGLVMGEKIYDVIGQIINEEDISQLYQELLDVPRAEWIPRVVKRLEEIMENNKQTLKQIEHLLVGHRFDKSKLTEYNNHIQTSIKKEDVKRFVFEFIKKYSGTIDLIDENKDLYRIIVPQSINKYIKRYEGKMVLEGTFYQSEYDYLALGNKTVLSMMKSILKPACSILTHPTLNGVLFIYRINAFDGRHQQRNGSIIGIIFDGKRSDIVDIDELWNFGVASKSKQQLIDSDMVEEGLKQANIKLNIITSKFKNEVTDSLNPFINQIQQTTTSYYINQINKLDSEIIKIEPIKNQNPSMSRKYDNLLYKREVLGKQYTDALKKVEKDMQIQIITELIGISLIIPPLIGIQADHNEEQNTRPNFIPKRSEFTKLNNQINKELSSTTHERLTKTPDVWFEYHKLFEEQSKDWVIKPIDEIIKKIRDLPQWWKIGDFGCGKAKIYDIMGERVVSIDHIAINKYVIACDMKETNLQNNSLDIIVFCLSLMGSNWEDYIKEAKRCLVINGTLLIAETTNSLGERLDTLRDALRKNSFQIYLEYEKGQFTFIEATKREFKTTYA